MNKKVFKKDWITESILKSSKKKEKFYKELKKNPNDHNLRL